METDFLTRRRAAGEAPSVGTGAFVLAVVAMLACGGEARAQTQLPGIVVQGATLEVPAAQRPSSGQSGASSAGSSGTAQGAAGGSTAGSGGESGSGTSWEAAGIATDRIGTAVSVVTADDLKRQQIRETADALRSLPGVEVSRTGTISGKTQVRIRGADANHTLVLIDGIESNDPNDGEFDFANLAVEDIERIEVIRGPQSGLYGSGAAGGVINIITRSGRGPLTVAARAETGAFGTTTASARLSGGTERAWMSLSALQRRSDGFNTALTGPEKDGSTLSSFSAKAGFRLGEAVTTEMVLRNVRNRFDRDAYGTTPTSPLAVAFDDASKAMTSLWQAGLNVRWDMLDGRLSHVFRANRTTTRLYDDDTTFLFVSRNASEQTRYGYTGTLRFETPLLVAVRHSLTGLIEQQEEAFTPMSDFADGLKRSRERLATAGEWRGEIADRLFLAASVRRDDNDAFKDFTTWRTSASLKLAELGLRPHASYGTGVRLPTMFEQFGFIPAFFTPNPNLKPEESRGWDAGIEVTLWPGRASLDVTYFHTDLTSRIDGLAPGPGFTFTAVNQPGESLREGVETTARVKVTHEITVSAAYTQLTARTATGEKEIRRPDRAGRIDASYAFAGGRGHLNLAAVYNGRMLDRTTDAFFNPVRVTLSDYWLVTAAASYKLQPGVEIYGRVENALNERYQEVFGYATPGLAAYAGVRISLEQPIAAAPERRDR